MDIRVVVKEPRKVARVFVIKNVKYEGDVLNKYFDMGDSTTLTHILGDEFKNILMGYNSDAPDNALSNMRFSGETTYDTVVFFKLLDEDDYEVTDLSNYDISRILRACKLYKAPTISDLTDDELIQLRSEISLNSLYLSDYKNSFGIDPEDAKNFFDGFYEYMYYLAECEMEDEDMEFNNDTLDELADSYDTSTALLDYASDYEDGDEYKEIDESMNSTSNLDTLIENMFDDVDVYTDGLRGIADMIYVSGPAFRGDSYPKFADGAINLSAVPDNVRNKWCDFTVNDDGDGIKCFWETQEDFDTRDAKLLIREIRRCIYNLADICNQTESFTVDFEIVCRDGRQYGYHTETITIEPQITESKKRKNPLKQAAKWARKRQKGLGAFVKLNAGDVQTGVGMFNNAVGAGDACGTCESFGENMTISDKLLQVLDNMHESIEGDQMVQDMIDDKNANFEADKQATRDMRQELAKQGIATNTDGEPITETAEPKTINIKAALNELDKENYRDLVNLYYAADLSMDDKKQLARKLADGENSDSIYDFLATRYGIATREE